MQVHRNKLRLSAALLVLAMGAVACGGGGDDEGAAGPAEEGASGGTYSVQIGEPENPLVPGNTTETEGGQVVDALWTGLVTYDPQTSEVQYDGVAESIESEDSTTWTIKLKEGWTFHDGTPVTADSFIKAWNYTANSANAQGSSYFFANVEGYDALQAEEGKAPAATEMTGLKKVSDTEFTVTLTSPFRQYPVTTGYAAFYPMPEAFFAEGGADKLGKQPIGNGPFKADAEFKPGQGFTISRYDDYAGDAAKADSVQVKVYTDVNTAYTDVQAGNLDIIGEVPPDAITTYKDEFGERSSERETSSFTYVGFPTYDPRFADKKVRQAFSMAIDREGITQAIFNGTRAPAYSAISPVVAGSRDDACKYCEYKPDEAKALLAETDFDTSKPVDLWFNAGAGHDEWMQAVGNNLRDNLGIQYKLQGSLQFAEYLPKGDAKGFTGPFRLGWAMDYPSPQNYLEPLYSTAALAPAGSNQTFYSNPEFDALIKEGNGAESDEAAIEAYQKAEDILLEDMPIAPMFFGRQQTAWSEKVDNVVVDAFTRIRLDEVTVNQ